MPDMDLQCRQCGDVLKSSDEITSSLTNTRDGLKVVRQYWHLACWHERATAGFNRWAQTARGIHEP
jgi:hypothetical protein